MVENYSDYIQKLCTSSPALCDLAGLQRFADQGKTKQHSRAGSDTTPELRNRKPALDLSMVPFKQLPPPNRAVELQVILCVIYCRRMVRRGTHSSNLLIKFSDKTANTFFSKQQLLGHNFAWNLNPAPMEWNGRWGPPSPTCGSWVSIWSHPHINLFATDTHWFMSSVIHGSVKMCH